MHHAAMFFLHKLVFDYILVYNSIAAREKLILSSFLGRSDQRFCELVGLYEEVKKEEKPRESRKEPVCLKRKKYHFKGLDRSPIHKLAWN